MTKQPIHDAEDLTHRIETIGAEAAFQALLEVCEDRKAPAPARATAGTSLLRAAGRFDKDRHRSSNTPPEEMTAAELAAEIARLRANRERLATGLPMEEDEDEDEDEGLDEDDKPNDMFG